MRGAPAAGGAEPPRSGAAGLLGLGRDAYLEDYQHQLWFFILRGYFWVMKERRGVKDINGGLQRP